LQPCSHAALQPCSLAALQPCSLAALQLCSHAAMQPCCLSSQLCSLAAVQPGCCNDQPCNQNKQPCSPAVPGSSPEDLKFQRMLLQPRTIRLCMYSPTACTPACPLCRMLLLHSSSTSDHLLCVCQHCLQLPLGGDRS